MSLEKRGLAHAELPIAFSISDIESVVDFEITPAPFDPTWILIRGQSLRMDVFPGRLDAMDKFGIFGDALGKPLVPTSFSQPSEWNFTSRLESPDDIICRAVG